MEGSDIGHWDREYGDRIGFSEERGKFSFRYVDFEVLIDFKKLIF